MSLDWEKLELESISSFFRTEPTDTLERIAFSFFLEKTKQTIDDVKLIIRGEYCALTLKDVFIMLNTLLRDKKIKSIHAILNLNYLPNTSKEMLSTLAELFGIIGIVGNKNLVDVHISDWLQIIDYKDLLHGMSNALSGVRISICESMPQKTFFNHEDTVLIMKGESAINNITYIQLLLKGSVLNFKCSSNKDADIYDYNDIFTEMPHGRYDAIFMKNIDTDAQSTPEIETITSEKYSVKDIFGDNIILRDLRPRNTNIRSIDSLKDILNLNKGFLPRKNNIEFSHFVKYFIDDISGNIVKNVIYVGDTVFNDGSVVKNLHKLGNFNVMGFICNEMGFGPECDFRIGPIYFSLSWKNLINFTSYLKLNQFSFDHDTIVIFDLDQTVYAAKGRDDEALRIARFKAISSFLAEAIPEYRLDPKRDERLYRTIDDDSYHRATLDNMDYIVILTLSVSIGIYDIQELIEILQSPDVAINSIIDDLYKKVEFRRKLEPLEKAWDRIREVFYNMRFGDQTPSKTFREKECLITAAHMVGEDNGNDLLPEACIYLNREVFDFAKVMQERGCYLLALSDRPPEATCIINDEGEIEVDLMNIKMKVKGQTIESNLYDKILND